jgi:hypothetical protein
MTTVNWAQNTEQRKLIGKSRMVDGPFLISLSVFFVLCFVLSSLLSWVAGLSILDFSISFLCSVFCAQFTVVLSHWIVHSWFLYRFSLFCVLCSVHCCLESLDCPFLISLSVFFVLCFVLSSLLYWVLNEDFQANYHGRGLKFGNKNVLETTP